MTVTVLIHGSKRLLCRRQTVHAVLHWDCWVSESNWSVDMEWAVQQSQRDCDTGWKLLYQWHELEFHLAIRHVTQIASPMWTKMENGFRSLTAWGWLLITSQSPWDEVLASLCQLLRTSLQRLRDPSFRAPVTMSCTLRDLWLRNAPPGPHASCHLQLHANRRLSFPKETTADSS